jgi:hypothetical protein
VCFLGLCKEWLAFVVSRRTDDNVEVQWDFSDPSKGQVKLHLNFR